MQYETKRRSVLKAVSWRTLATITTTLLVFIFTGRATIAITVGLLEVIAKLLLYFVHERVWQKIWYGKRDVPAFVVWLTGLPASGKKAVGDAVHRLLKRERFRVERLDSRDIRSLFPEVGFSPKEVESHVKRAGHLVSMLERNGVSVVFSSVSPFLKSRQFTRDLVTNFIEVHMSAPVAVCEERDADGHYARARRGDYVHFPGVDMAYEEPLSPDVTIDADGALYPEAAAREIVTYIKRKIVRVTS